MLPRQLIQRGIRAAALSCDVADSTAAAAAACTEPNAPPTQQTATWRLGDSFELIVNPDVAIDALSSPQCVFLDARPVVTAPVVLSAARVAADVQPVLSSVVRQATEAAAEATAPLVLAIEPAVAAVTVLGVLLGYPAVYVLYADADDNPAADSCLDRLPLRVCAFHDASGQLLWQWSVPDACVDAAAEPTQRLVARVTAALPGSAYSSRTVVQPRVVL